MTNNLKKKIISSSDLSLEVRLNDGEIVKTPLYFASYGFSENIYRFYHYDEKKIKKSIEKYLSKNQNVPLIIETPQEENKQRESKLIPRNSINYIKLIYKK